jgi:hypothetical protein
MHRHQTVKLFPAEKAVLNKLKQRTKMYKRDSQLFLMKINE